MKKELLPSDFMSVHPWSSVLAKSENESLACSIMATRNWKGNYWAGNFTELTYKDYIDYRTSIGATNNASVEQFDKVHVYCKFPDTAALFSPTWKKMVDDFEMEQQSIGSVPLVVENSVDDTVDGRFKISWDGNSYKVSIPNYGGGEVVPIQVFKDEQLMRISADVALEMVIGERHDLRNKVAQNKAIIEELVAACQMLKKIKPFNADNEPSTKEAVANANEVIEKAKQHLI